MILGDKMGKKKKVDINSAPLQAVTIGKVKDNKYGWVVVLFLFSLFGAIIYFYSIAQIFLNILVVTN